MAKHTLETIVDELKEKPEFENKSIGELEKEIYPTLLIDFVKASEEVISKEILPTPLFRMNYDENNFNISIENLNGYAESPQKNSIDFDALDMTLAFSLKDIPMLLVGETGTGKTKTIKTLGKTILPKGSYNYKRLAGSSGSGSLLGYFTKIDLSTGYPRPILDIKKTYGIAMLFIDEANRGRDDEKMQLIDGEVAIAGKSALLGPEIPILTENGVEFNEKIRKKLFVVGAINPDSGMASSKGRNKYVGTRILDDAERRRWTIVNFGDILGSSGESINLAVENPNRFEDFINLFTTYISEDLGIDKDKISENMLDDWLSMYAYITDSKKTEHAELYTAFEFSDIVSLILNGNFKGSLNYEMNVIQDINKKLSLEYGVKFGYNQSISEGANATTRLESILDELQNESPADVAKVGTLAQGIKTIRDIKNSFSKDNPIEYYKQLTSPQNGKIIKNAVNIADIAYSWAIVSAGKSFTMDNAENEKVTMLMNEMLNEYKQLEYNFQQEVFKTSSYMNIDDTSRGIKIPAIIKSINYAKKELDKNSGQNSYVDYMIKMLAYEGGILGRINPRNDISKVIIGRTIADLAVFSEFLDEYKSEIDATLSQQSNPSDNLVINTIYEVYSQMKTKHARSMPQIYMHRIPRILGLPI